MKNCFNCDFYGQCRLEVYTCKDWKPYHAVITDVSSFDGKWRKLHKRFWRRFDIELSIKRMAKFEEYLKRSNNED